MNEILQGMNLNNFSVKSLLFLVFGMNCLLFRNFFLLINVRHLSNFRNETCHIKEQHQTWNLFALLCTVLQIYTLIVHCTATSSVWLLFCKQIAVLTELLTYMYSTFEKIQEQKTVFIFEFFFVLLLSLSLLFQYCYIIMLTWLRLQSLNVVKSNT